MLKLSLNFQARANAAAETKEDFSKTVQFFYCPPDFFSEAQVSSCVVWCFCTAVSLPIASILLTDTMQVDDFHEAFTIFDRDASGMREREGERGEKEEEGKNIWYLDCHASCMRACVCMCVKSTYPTPLTCSGRPLMSVFFFFMYYRRPSRANSGAISTEEISLSPLFPSLLLFSNLCPPALKQKILVSSIWRKSNPLHSEPTVRVGKIGTN
jgi:hypothetical protein